MIRLDRQFQISPPVIYKRFLGSGFAFISERGQKKVSIVNHYLGHYTRGIEILAFGIWAVTGVLDENQTSLYLVSFIFCV